MNTVSLSKFTYIRSKKLRDSARGQECTMCIPGICNGDPSTTVWAHSNMGIHGKGKGIKATDWAGAFMCSDCHSRYDGRANGSRYSKEEIRDMFWVAMSRSWQILIDMGIIKVEGA